MIIWDPSLETGDVTIDGQHRELFSIVEELRVACVDDRSEACIDAILNRLMSYTLDHFSAEQHLMARTGYPPENVSSHAEEHIRLKRHVEILIEQRRRGELRSVMPVALFLQEWLRTHIRQVDREFVEFMRAQAAR